MIYLGGQKAEAHAGEPGSSSQTACLLLQIMVCNNMLQDHKM